MSSKDMYETVSSKKDVYKTVSSKDMYETVSS